jgi:hypothetical protein
MCEPDIQKTGRDVPPTTTATAIIVCTPTASITSGKNPGMDAVLRYNRGPLHTINIVYGWAAIVV